MAGRSPIALIMMIDYLDDDDGDAGVLSVANGDGGGEDESDLRFFSR